MAFLEARVYSRMTNRLMARGIIDSLMFEHPRDATVIARAAAILADYQCYSDAFRITDRQLQLDPKDTIALVNKGDFCVLIGDYSNAIPPLTLALSSQVLHDVGELAAAVVALAGIALGVLVGEDAGGGFRHGVGDEILAGDQFELGVLPLHLV